MKLKRLRRSTVRKGSAFPATTRNIPRLRLGKRTEAKPRNLVLNLTGKPEAYRNARRHSRDSAILASSHSSARKLCVPVIRCAFLLSLALAVHSNLQAQQPFTVDDADVTEHKRFQLQISHEFDILPRSAHPSLRQNTTVFVLNYGLLRDVEIGVDYPLIVISNAAGTTPQTIKGFGDLNFHVKYNFLKEAEGKRRPALTISFAMEVPTGDTAKGLGSGLFDYSVNGVLQKSLTTKTTLRANGGIVFAGNTSTGFAGIRTRGRVFTAGASLVRQFTPKLNLGIELTGAASNNLNLGAGQLQTQFGGNYQLTEKMSLDFGVLAGKFNNPRVGAQIGMSLDF